MSLRIVRVFCIFFFKFYEILFENNFLYEKVISIKIIIYLFISSLPLLPVEYYYPSPTSTLAG